MHASIPVSPSLPDTQRFALAPSEAFTIWMTGLSGAGKSTLAQEMQLACGSTGAPAMCWTAMCCATG